jgi:hypothetical protein
MSTAGTGILGARGPAAIAAIALLFSVPACGNGGSTTGSGAAGSGTGGSGAVGGSGGAVGGSGGAAGGSGGGQGGSTTTGTTGAGACDTDPLHTGLVAQQTGVSVDSFDCQILKQAAAHDEPDAMIFKAIIYVESRFDNKAVACPNLPCGTPNGWTAAESGCFGLMQIVLACGPTPDNLGFLPNGHPDLATDMSSGDWPNSVFNPDVNIALGVAGIADNRAQVKKQFPGCTEDQYTMMAVGNYNSYGSTKSCTEYNKDYDNLVLMAYQEYSKAAGWPAHAY